MRLKMITPESLRETGLEPLSKEQNFINRLNAYLEYPLTEIGQRRVKEWLREYLLDHPQTKIITKEVPVYKTIVKYINGEKAAKTEYLAMDIIRVVCEHFKISEEEIKQRCRKAELVLARKFCFFLIKKYTSHSLKHMASLFGVAVLDHASVIHLIQSMHNLLQTDREMVDHMNEIEKKIIEQL